MPRKKWTPQENSKPLQKLRDKKKWQIALRRYLVEQKPSEEYAPYFGLDIVNLRQWLTLQFHNGITWDEFGTQWQLDHMVPLKYFDFSKEDDLRLCWHFTNLRVHIYPETDEAAIFNLLMARTYFARLYAVTAFAPCLSMIQKIDSLAQISDDHSPQVEFILQHHSYLQTINTFSSAEWEWLNNGKSLQQISRDLAILKKF